MRDVVVHEAYKTSLEADVSSGFSSESERPRIHKAAGAFRTISEVADDLHVPQHVLRFWESKFPQVRPLKRGGGRRYYRPEDVALLRRVADLLYTQGYTIKGVQRLLRDNAEASASVLQEPSPLTATALLEQFESEPEPTLVDEEQLEDSINIAPVDDVVPVDHEYDEVQYLRALLAEALTALEALRRGLD